MNKYLKTVNVIAVTTAVIAGLSFVGGRNPQGPDKAMRQQLLKNRELDYSIGRIKACGELKRYGVTISPESPDASLCADVVVTFPE